MKALLIEDNPGDARLIRAMLKGAGAGQFELAHVERLDEGLKRLAEEAFAVMLLDLNLPESQGLDTFARAYAQAPQMPIVVLTGLADEMLAVRAVQEGAQDYLIKGRVDGNLLARALRYAIERKWAEQMLRESAKFLQDIFDAIQDGISVLDRNLNILRVNRTMERWYSSQPLEGMKCFEAYHGRSERCETCPAVRALRRGTTQMDVVPTSGLKERGGWLELYAFPLLDAAGNATGVIEYVRDITERKRAETERERLLTAEQEQRLLAETLREVTLALTSQTNLQAVLDEILRQAQRLVPYHTAHIVLLKDGILRSARWRGYEAFGSQDFISSLIQPLADYPLDAGVVRSRKPLVVADTHQHPQWVVDEETAWVRSCLVLPICLHDRVLGLLRLDGDTSGKFSAEDAKRLQPLANDAAIALENTRLCEQVQRHAVELEQRAAERTRELAEAYERLKELDRLKSKFITDVSHELRTPVANIGMYLHLLKRGKPEKRARYMNVLKEQTNRLADLLEGIMDLSRLDLCKEKVEFAPVALNELVEQVVAAHQPGAEAAGLELIFEPDVALPPVQAERNQLAQVIANLVTNAINYTPAGQVRIVTHLEPDGGQAYLEVQDTGMGIEPEDRPHIFERFYRGQRVGSSNISGTGLGLAIVKEIVDLHGGRIEVQSQPGEGSTFSVWLPLEEGAVGQVGDGSD